MEADADKAENDVSNARAQLAAALELEAGVFQELALVRDSLDAVASSLRLSDESVGGSDGGAKVGVAAAVAAGQASSSSLPSEDGTDSDVPAGPEELERELVDLTATAAALGVRVKFWAWKSAAGFLPDSDRSSVEPVLAAVCLR